MLFWLYLCLDHGRPLGAQYAHRLKHVYNALVLHAFQIDTERDKYASAPDTSAAVYCDGSFLAELLFGLMHLAEELDEAFARLRHALLGPVSELKLADSARLAIACIRHFEFTQNILWHVVLCNGLNYNVLVADGAIRRPILMTLFLTHFLSFK